VLGWLAKSLMSQLLTKDLEAFKVSLKTEADSSAQQLRNDLEKTAFEHEVKFSKLHEKRAEVIAETYSLLVVAHRELSNFVSIVEWSNEPSKKEKYFTAMNAVTDFYLFFSKNKIYIPKEACEQIEEFVLEMRKKAIGFGVHLRHEEHQMTDDRLEKMHEAWDEAWKYFSEMVPEAKSALESKLRELLGDVG
jgi:hypothetical protein